MRGSQNQTLYSASIYNSTLLTNWVLLYCKLKDSHAKSPKGVKSIVLYISVAFENGSSHRFLSCYHHLPPWELLLTALHDAQRLQMGSDLQSDHIIWYTWAALGLSQGSFGICLPDPPDRRMRRLGGWPSLPRPAVGLSLCGLGDRFLSLLPLRSHGLGLHHPSLGGWVRR
jgi:hypothetical protein